MISFEMCFLDNLSHPCNSGNSLKIIENYTQNVVPCLRRRHRDSISTVKNHFFQFLKTVFVTSLFPPS